MVEPSTTIDDRQLVLRLMEKDERALAYLVEHHGRMVSNSLAVHFRGVLDPLELQGVMNMATWKVWSSIGSFNPSRGSLRTWYQKIAYREAVNCLRESRGCGEVWLLEFDPGLNVPRPDDTSLSDSPLVKQLLRIIADLPRLQQAVILADLAAGEKADDERLARKHGTTVNSIRASRSIARRRIREELEAPEENQEPPSGASP